MPTLRRTAPILRQEFLRYRLLRISGDRSHISHDLFRLYSVIKSAYKLYYVKRSNAQSYI
jgi:hypothetical protein